MKYQQNAKRPNPKFLSFDYSKMDQTIQTIEDNFITKINDNYVNASRNIPTKISNLHNTSE